MSTQVFGVFSGGGIKAAAFVGALKEAESRLEFRGVGGTSAGAIIAALLACGYKADELEDVLFTAPYSTFFKPQRFRFIFRPHKGFFDFAPLLKWLRKRIEAKVKNHGKSGVTFKDLNNLRGALPLKIVATNVSAQDIQIYSTSETPLEEIAHAVLASCSFPILFPAVRHGTYDLVDGGVMSNFPMWLFDEDRESCNEPTSVLGFALVPPHDGHDAGSSFHTHLYSIFESILVAQDRVQERYLDRTGLANVIRINIPTTATFDRDQTQAARESLIRAGRLAALDYFGKAPASYQERVGKSHEPSLSRANEALVKGDHKTALSWIARDHILRGGVAQDLGLADGRTLVRYYIDLMEAATEREKLAVLAEILANKIGSLSSSFDRIVGIKKGNVLLAAQTAFLIQKPLAIAKSDLSYKIGAPFDGLVVPKEIVVLVDDIASDASMLVRAVRQLNMHGIKVSHVVTLIERGEGDARKELDKINCTFKSVCKITDEDIKANVERLATFPGED